MPDTYTETVAWVTPVTGPANTELADAETSITLPAQALTSRSAYLYSIIAPGTGTGVTRLREVATVAAMKALNVNTNGDVVYVQTGTGAGLYRFNAEAVVGADVAFQVYAVTGTGTAGNYHAIYGSALDVANGIPSLTAAGKIRTNELANSLVAFVDDTYGLATQIATSSTTFVDAVSGANHPLISLTVNAGDVLDISGNFEWSVTSTSAFWQCVVHDGAADVVPTNAQQTASGSYPQAAGNYGRVQFRAKYTVVNTGALTVRMQHKVVSGVGTSTMTEPVGLYVVQYRP